MRAAVLGSPIGHSLSPVLHRAAYAALGLTDWSYEAIECDEAGLPGLLDGLDRSWAGLSLTMPLKRAVLPLLDEVSALARDVGGANTVVFADGRRFGHNTDVGGMVDALREAGVATPESTVVLGAGATAGSALAALRDLGLSRATVVARDLSRTGELRGAADRLGVRIVLRTWDEVPRLLDTDLLVSTVPSGVADVLVPMLSAPSAGGGGARPGTVFDVVYEPWPTPLAVAARAAGIPVVGGFPMLLHQAARQVELMTGRPAPVAAMRAAGERELSARASRR